MNKPKGWIEDVLGSLDNAKRAVPNEAFLKRMEDMAVAYVVPLKKVSLRTSLAIAASLLLLIAINFTVLSNYVNSESKSKQEVSATSNYNLMPAKTLYHE